MSGTRTGCCPARATVEWKAIVEGQELPKTTFGPLTVTDFVRYQGASGDMNPIHHDTEFAKEAGFPGPFAVGMLQAGLLASRAADWLGPANIRRFKVRFREIAWPGDVLTLTGRVVAKSETGRIVDLELHAHRQTGGVHAQAWATFDLSSAAENDVRRVAGHADK
jgi:acyl dehydratase